MESLSTTVAPTYVLVRILFLRLLGFVYFMAFLVAYRQNKALIGDRGITPAKRVLDRAEARAERERKKKKAQAKSNFLWDCVTSLRNDIFSFDPNSKREQPVATILWLAQDRKSLNPWLDGIALLGLLLSSVVLVLGRANLFVLTALFVCHRSLWAVGGEWYAYGWEGILSEVGLHSLFMVPMWKISGLTTEVSVPMPVVWCLRWLLFRIMLGAGLIKIKSSDRKWKDFTALRYFYETQPLPHRLSRLWHNLPPWMLKGLVLGNHLVELVVPWFLLLPFRNLRIVAGCIQIAFQVALVLSGNLSFLNWLTVVPALFCFDDAFVGPLVFSQQTLDDLAQTRKAASALEPTQLPLEVMSTSFLVLIALFSIPHIRNFLSNDQVMIGSFDTYQLVHTFGAFGSVSEERTELIVCSSIDGQEWREYQFAAKPGNTRRHPRWISPYHARLDWQMWIAARLRSIHASPWVYFFLIKLLESDGVVLDLLADDPWLGAKPQFIKVDLYRYRFAPLADSSYWDREYIGRFYPRVGKGATLQSLWRQADRVGYS